MHADLKWLAENVSEWGGTYSFKHIFLEDGMADYSSVPDDVVLRTFTRDQWQAARDELISPFSSPEEDEAWQAAEKRMDIIGHNGGTGEHYSEPMDDNCPAARIGDLGNQAHNLGCDYQNNEDLSDELSKVAIMLWDLAKKSETSAQATDKQKRYQDSAVEDWIDEAARTFTAEEFRGAMRFTIGMYNRRMGKKDDLISEIEKIRDYATRWLEVEQGR